MIRVSGIHSHQPVRMTRYPSTRTSLWRYVCPIYGGLRHTACKGRYPSVVGGLVWTGDRRSRGDDNRTFQLAHPNCEEVSRGILKLKRENRCSYDQEHHISSWHAPGVKASQSAQRSLPGIVRISSARAFSLRSCWRLLMPFGILSGK